MPVSTDDMTSTRKSGPVSAGEMGPRHTSRDLGKDEPGFFEASAYGFAVETPARVTGLAAGAAVLPFRAVEAYQGEPLEGMPPEVMQPVEDAVRRKMEGVTGLRRPMGDEGKAANEGMAGLSMTTPFLGMAGPFAPLLAAGGYILPQVGERWRQMAEERGAGPLGQAGAALAPELAGLMIPGGITRVPRVAGKVKTLAKTFRLTKEARGVQKMFQLSKAQLADASSWSKGLVPESVGGTERVLDEWIDTLDEGILAMEAGEFSTTPMLLRAREDIGEALAGVERMLSGMSDTSWGRRMAGQRSDTLRTFRNRFDDLIPEETIDDAVGAYRALRTGRDNAQKANWTDEMKAAMPPVDVRSERRVARSIVDANDDLPAFIAPEIRAMSKWGKTVSWEKWQKMRSHLLRRGRIGESAAMDAMQRAQKNSIDPELLGTMQETLVKLTRGAKGKQYERALAGTRKFYEDFDENRKVVRALNKMSRGDGSVDFSNPQRVLSAIKSADNPADEALYTYNMLKQSPHGVKGYQRTLIDDVLGTTWKEISEGGMGSARTRFNKMEGILRNSLEPDQLAELDTLISKLGQIGKAGSDVVVAGTGSAVPSLVSTLFMGPEATRNVIGWAKHALGPKVAAALGRPSNQVRQRMLAEMVLNPKIAVALWRMPTARTVDAWLINWSKLTKMAAARSTRGVNAYNVSTDDVDNARGVISRADLSGVR